MTPKTAKQLFLVAAAPIIDNASAVRTIDMTKGIERPFNQAQSISAQDIGGAIRTVAVERAEMAREMARTAAW